MNEKVDIREQPNSVGVQFDREHLDELVDDCYSDEGLLIQERCKDVVRYVNNFLCLFERSFCFGFRFNTSQERRYYDLN